MKKRFLLWRFKRAVRNGKRTLTHRYDINYINADMLRVSRAAKRLLPYENEIGNDLIINIISEA